MNVTRTIHHAVTITKGELIRALKNMHPANIVIQALPDSGGNVGLETAGGVVTLRFNNEEGRHL